jgi:GNAT superfamily N-acetyltransferase
LWGAFLKISDRQLVIRPFGAADSVEGLTCLLHRAFQKLGDMGLNYTAVDQSPDVTQKRIAAGECYVAEVEGRLAGTVVLKRPSTHPPCEGFDDASLASAHQLAVEREFQGRGVGSGLMEFAEQWALRTGHTGIWIDTAEPATHLVRFYARRGYELVGHAQWKGKRYRSVIMRKSFVRGPQ